MQTDYAEVTVLVNGCVDAAESFTDLPTMAAFIDGIGDASNDGEPTELYIMVHPHPMTGAECMCVQYVTDHTPDYTWNMEGDR